jgi:flagellar hook-associated protein 3 FlgL
MRITDSAFTDGFLYQVNQLQQQQNTLQSEASSGQSVTLPEDNPSVMSEVLDDQSTQSSVDQYSNNITQLQSTATISASAMNTLQSLTSQVSTLATDAANSANAAQLPTYASEMTSLIQQAISLGNTTDGEGNYIFGGTNSNTPPFVATTDASGNITGVTYQGNSGTAKSEIASGVTVSATVPGENTSGTGATGLFTDSSAGVNLFGDMISLQQHMASGDTSTITSTDIPALSKDSDHVISQISANGVMQSALTSAGNIASSQSTNLTTQISSATNANMADTLTQLDQTQTAYEAALESGTKIMQLSLVDFLT